jgi:hypothetical protein
MSNVKICSKSDKCEFNLKYKNSLLNKICKGNCYNIYYDYVFERGSYVKKNTAFKKIFNLKKRFGNDISSNHLPKMNFIGFLSSIGGLFSMWFGISLFHLLLFIYEKFVYVFVKYFQFNDTIINLHIRLVHWIENLKLNNLFKLLIIIIYSTAMLYQISGIIESYLKYETLTRFEMNQKQLNPVIVLSISPITIKFELRKIFPEMKLDEEYINGLKIKDKHTRDVKLYAVFRKY